MGARAQIAGLRPPPKRSAAKRIHPSPPGGEASCHDLGITTSMPIMPRAQRCRDLLLTVAVNAISAPPATFFYGGQAVIEGVLMRGKDRYAVAARRPNGEIAVCTDVLRSRVYTASVWRRPFLRGVAGLYETIHLGMRALQWSALVQLGQDARPQRCIRRDPQPACLIKQQPAVGVPVGRR